DYEFLYDVPATYTGGELNLSVLATDRSGRSGSAQVALPLVVNEPPLMALTEFASYKVGGTYQKIINTADRLNYGEFWLRTGETFRLSTKLSDDAGLRRYRIERLKRDGSRVLEHETDLQTHCPDPLVTHVPKKAVEVLF